MTLRTFHALAGTDVLRLGPPRSYANRKNSRALSLKMRRASRSAAVRLK
jgi:hypothetical protein